MSTAAEGDDATGAVIAVSVVMAEGAELEKLKGRADENEVAKSAEVEKGYARAESKFGSPDELKRNMSTAPQRDSAVSVRLISTASVD